MDSLTSSKQLSNRSEVFLGSVDGEVFVRLVSLTVYLLGHYLWLTHGELEAFATHVLNQDGQCKFTTTLNFPGVRAADVDNLE
jgi:hypothetical protein